MTVIGGTSGKSKSFHGKSAAASEAESLELVFIVILQVWG